MASKTTAQTGPYSAGSTWVGGVKPSSGDTVVVASGHTLTIDEDCSLGSNSSGVGHAFNVQATDSTTFGTLIVADGVTMTLKGYDTGSNTLGYIARYAKFQPAPGSTIVGDVASAMASIIDNRGIVEAIGTEAKQITFTSPAANVDWNNTVASEAFSGSAQKYDPVNKVACVKFTNPWISNAAGTGPGSLGDSSVSFSGKTPADILTTEVATLAEVNSSGKYCVYYDLGFVFFYNDPGTAASFTKTYKYLTFTKGWGISSVQNTTYNEAKFDYCAFRYMGTSGSDSWALAVTSKNSTASAANRLFYLKNSTVLNCKQFLGLKSSHGTDADPLKIEGNTFYRSPTDSAYGSIVSFYRSQVTYVDVDSNVINSTDFLLPVATYGAVTDYTRLRVRNNTGVCPSLIVMIPHVSRMPGGEISGNNIGGVGNTADSRAVQGVGGAPVNRAIIRDNKISNSARGIHYGPYCSITGNTLVNALHHSITGPTEEDVFITDVTVSGNVICAEAGSGDLGYDASPHIELGYNHRHHLDNFTIENNTCAGNPAGWIGFGDMQDNNGYTLLTRLSIRNNAGKKVISAGNAVSRRAAASLNLTRLHLSQFDYNGDHGWATRYAAGAPTQGTFTGLDTLPGVSLHTQSFTTKSGGALAFVYTSATNQTLAWGAGAAVQLVLDSGTATGGGHNSVNGIAGVHSGYLDATSKSWSTTKTDAACPMLHWVKITGGTGAGQIRAITNNTATKLTVVPGWTTAPDATSTFAIIRSEVALADGSETLQAGIYLPDLPTSSATASAVDLADHSVTTDPQFVNAPGRARADFTPSSAAYDNTGFGGLDIGAIAFSLGGGSTAARVRQILARAITATAITPTRIEGIR
jgi:hypothetical protein